VLTQLLYPLCPPHRGNHGRTTGTLILLISIRFPLENKEAGAPRDGPVGALTL
jgi:hypothetical protein